MRAHAGDAPLRVLLDEATEASREAQEGLRVMIQDRTLPGLDHASLAADLPRDRVADGTLELDAVIGEGCRVTVRLPAPTPSP